MRRRRGPAKKRQPKQRQQPPPPQLQQPPHKQVHDHSHNDCDATLNRVARWWRGTEEPDSDVWLVPYRSALTLLVLANCVSAVTNVFDDCDETFNYWEPTHWILYGFGQQTWEYSPVYGLRSYAYLLLYAAPGRVVHAVVTALGHGVTNKVMVFINMRMCIGIATALCQTMWYWGIAKRFGSRVAHWTLFFMGVSAGFFVASTAFLPNTFTMCGFMAAHGLWFVGAQAPALFLAGASVLLGSPFPVIALVPMAFALLYTMGVVRASAWAIVTVCVCIGGSVLVDHAFYDRIIVPLWNIVMYNALSSETSSVLYGVEPPSFYVVNLLLNFNWMAIAAAVALPPKSFESMKWAAAAVLPLYLWFALVIVLPHKEQRFLFPMYPFMCLAAAFTVYMAQLAGEAILTRLALSTNYGAPFGVYRHLADDELKLGQSPSYPVHGKVNVCVGKEWYRYVTSYYLPDARFQLRYVESSFKGLLPKPYASSHWNASSIAPDGMNNMNRADPSVYVPLSECHYMIDLEEEHQQEEPVRTMPHWELLFDAPFVDVARSPSITRAFWIPFWSHKRNSWASYQLLRNNGLIARQNGIGSYRLG